MEINFSIKYQTHFGQNIYICGNHKLLGNNDPQKAYLMEYFSPEEWKATLNIETKKPLIYSYLVKNEFGEILAEWTERSIELANYSVKKIQLNDSWLSPSLDTFNYATDFFNEILPQAKKTLRSKKNFTHHFILKPMMLKEGQGICLLGNHPKLGNWDRNKFIPLQYTQNDQWETLINLTNQEQVFQYKYGVYDIKSKQLLYFEKGENRHFFPAKKDEQCIIHDANFQFPWGKKWRGAGVAIPVFSLRSEKSLGVGEFLDLKLMADWCKKTHQKIIQILPINDTTANHTWTDSYPYAAISIYALHPLYLNISETFGYSKAIKPKDYQSIKKELNKQKLVDYERVMQHKWHFIEAIFKQNKEQILVEKSFKAFLKKNEYWLKPYAAFCVLRDENKTADFNLWGDHNKFSTKKVAVFFKPSNFRFDAVMKHCFVQWQLHEQLSNALEHLHQNNITIKGDLPIGIYRHSAEAWHQPELFLMNHQAGAPPDDFSELGQNWGFPTYDWEKMKEDDYQWWKDRFQFMNQYFDCLRIDHILGFFRIWQIPLDATQGILGYFEPAIAITQKELEDHHLWLGEERLTQPMITSETIEASFGDDAIHIFKKFFQEKNHTIRFKAAYDTQRKVFESVEPKEIREKLLNLHTQVLFIKDENNGYHPRFNLHKTSSYAYLNDWEKQKLYDLYIHYFFERQEGLWEKSGLEKLPELKKASSMLTCAEDLGLVPAVVPKVMEHLGLLSLQIQRMPNDPKKTFSHPADAPYWCVVTPSSHDTSPLRMWWEENEHLTQKFYHEMLQMHGEAPNVMPPNLAQKIVEQHLHSPACLCIVPLQDYFATFESTLHPNKEEERINVPANMPHYWRYRMHISLEALNEKSDFNVHLKEMVEESHRSCS